MDEVKLGTIADVVSGLVTRRFDLKNSNEGKKLAKNNEIKEFYTITQKSLSENYIDSNLFEKICISKEMDKKYLAKKGDIIMKLATPYNAAIVEADMNDVIIPSNFAIIRLMDDNYNPRYISLILNSNDIKKQMKKYIEGDFYLKISIRNLKNLKIRNIEINRQKKYGELIKLIEIRKRLLLKKIDLEGKITNKLISDIN